MDLTQTITTGDFELLIEKYISFNKNRHIFYKDGKEITRGVADPNKAEEVFKIYSPKIRYKSDITEEWGNEAE